MTTRRERVEKMGRAKKTAAVSKEKVTMGPVRVTRRTMQDAAERVRRARGERGK